MTAPAPTPASATATDWRADFAEQLAGAGIVTREVAGAGLGPALCRTIAVAHWARAAELAQALGARHAGLWGEPPEATGGNWQMHACLVRDGRYLLLHTEPQLLEGIPTLASQAHWYPGVARLERHARDLLGIDFADAADQRRWTRHRAWPAEHFPLRADFPSAGNSTARVSADADYPFVAVAGAGVSEIAVGPVHAGIIEPGHFRFQTVGETILRLETRLGYCHKGIEKRAVGRSPVALIRLAGRVAGDATVAHAWAACQALECASGCTVPPRALVLRALLAERERIVAHLSDIGGICNDVGFTFALAQCGRLTEQWRRRNAELFGHRLLMDRLVPGGVAVDLDSAGIRILYADHVALRRASKPLFDILLDHPSLDDRLIGTGVLAPADAAELGCLGYLARASGQAGDVRRDSPYAPYARLTPDAVVYEAGDVAARVAVRMDELRQSLELCDRLLRGLPDGPLVAMLPKAEPGTAGFGLVEGWRGETLCYLRFDAAGRIARYFPRDPSWFSWPALERLILGNIVADFPVCNKSVNGSYSGVDL